jgi:hypothetical protein
MLAPCTGCEAVSGGTTFSVQFEIRVPHEPLGISSAKRTHVFYELYMTNFSSAPLDVHSIEVQGTSARVTLDAKVYTGRLNNGLTPDEIRLSRVAVAVA